MANADRIDPYRGYNFRIEMDGITVAAFQECTGLTLTTDAVEYREGTDPTHVRKLTGLRKATNITLKHGITQNKDLMTKYKSVLDGNNYRFNGSITLDDEGHNPVLQWHFVNGWICKWEGPSLKASSNDVAIESMEICYEELKLPLS